MIFTSTEKIFIMGLINQIFIIQPPFFELLIFFTLPHFYYTKNPLNNQGFFSVFMSFF